MQVEQTVFFILTKDPTQVQGKTEAHYLSAFFAKRSQSHVFAPLESSVTDAKNHSLPIKGIKGAILLNIFFLPYWLYQFHTERPDVVYCYQNVILPALLGQYIFNATVAFDLQSDPYDQAQEFSHKEGRGLAFDVATKISNILHTVVLQRADYVFVLSEPLAKSVIKNYGVDREVIRLMPLGVDTDRFTPSTEKYDRTSIVYIGSLARYRGIDTLLEAVSTLPDDIQRDVRVDLYGDGPEKYISELITAATNSGPIELNWHGLIPHEDIPRRVARSDIAVSPIPPLEAYQVSSPAKVFEYLAMGLPIVASRIEPHERILTDGENALLYNPESATDLSQQLEHLVRDDEQRRIMAKNARESSLEFDWKNRFEIIEDVLLD